MNQEQKQLVQSTFTQVLPIAPIAAELFYQRLFELDPSLRALFKHDMQEQGRMLMSVLKIAVSGLDRLDQLLPTVQALGMRHATYHVRPEHYATVGEALLWTLEKGLGNDFTPTARAAWAAVYDLLACVMKDAAYAPVVA